MEYVPLGQVYYCSPPSGLLALIFTFISPMSCCSPQAGLLNSEMGSDHNNIYIYVYIERDVELEGGLV